MPRSLQTNGKFKGDILCAVPMSEYTSFRVGGRVDYLAFPRDLDDLRRVLRVCAQEGVPYFILGNGTNLLVRDGGIRGLAISLAKGFCRVKVLEEGPEGSLVFAEPKERVSQAWNGPQGFPGP
jgi:UDP-N-acetylenolpyruvoylglucosamine reductase